VADYTPKFPTGRTPFTLTAGGTIVGGDCVTLSASDTVVSSAAAGAAIGVAAHDAVSGAKVVVWPLGCVHETVAGAGGVTVGDKLKVGATAGVLITDGAASIGVTVGIALNTAIATAPLRWKGYGSA